MQAAPLPAKPTAPSNSAASPEAINRLMLLEQWGAMRGDGITPAKAVVTLRVPPRLNAPVIDLSSFGA